MNEPRNKAIIDITETDTNKVSWIKKLINSLPIFLWGLLTGYLIWHYGAFPDLAFNRDLYLNVISVSVAYNVLSLVAGVTLLSWLNPWIRTRELWKGDYKDHLVAVVYWVGTLIALSVVILGAN
jgi:hypothetical protein